MSDLGRQVVQAGGATTHRLDELLRRPASEVLARGERPPVAGTSAPVEIMGLRPMDIPEAQALLMRLEGEDVRSAVNLTEKVRIRHHAIARLMAAGKKRSEVSEIVGVSAATLAILERSPAFQSLLLEYMNMLDAEAIDAYQRLQIVGNLGIDELTDRITSRPTTFKNSEVLELVKLAADRTGLGPTTKQVTLNGRLSPADIRAVKATRPVVEAVYSEEGFGSGADFPPAVCDGGGADEAAEGGSPVREEPGEVASPSMLGTDLVTDLGEILGR